MWCYVGKATKIFMVVVAVVAVVGLVLGFGLLRHGHRGQAGSSGCEGNGCRPALPEPIPADATMPPPPLPSPPNPVAAAQGPTPA